MGKRGRPQKPGRRKGGRPVVVATFDRGTEQAQARRDMFAGNGYDPIGRAYAVGLLGEGQEAKDRLDMGRRYATAYHAEWAFSRYRCALDTSPRGGGGIDGTNDRREWIMAQSGRVAQTGCGAFFDQLVDPLRVHTDDNPAWLSRLIANALDNRRRALCGQTLMVADERDWWVLKAALMGLDALLSFRATGDRTHVQRQAA